MSIEVNSKEIDFFVTTVRGLEERVRVARVEELESCAYEIRDLLDKGDGYLKAVQRRLRKEGTNPFHQNEPREVKALVGRIRQIVQMGRILEECSQLILQRSGLAAAVLQN